MSTNTLTTVPIPDGFKHYQTSVTALSWEAWDALTDLFGWIERQWHVGADGKPCPEGTAGSHVHLQKESPLLNGGRITAFPPLEGREGSSS